MARISSTATAWACSRSRVADRSGTSPLRQLCPISRREHEARGGQEYNPPYRMTGTKYSEPLDVWSHGVVVAGLTPLPRRHCGPSTSRKRHDHSRYPSDNTAIEGFAPGAERTLWDQSQDGGQVAEAHHPRGPADGAEGPALDDAVG